MIRGQECKTAAGLLFLVGLLWFFALQIPAAELGPQLPLTQYGIDTWDGSDGLPQIRIRSIHQSRDGYLWLGTANGLLRFDGVSFTTFGVQSSGLKDNEISSIVEDQEGALWIGTYGGGLTRFKDGQFVTLTVADGLPDNLIRKADLDPAGNVWVATPRGVACLSHGKITTFTTRDGLPRDYISGICAGSSQGVFAVAGGRLNRFVNGRFVTEPAAMSDADGRMDSMAIGQDGAVWMTFEDSHIKCWQDGKAVNYSPADFRGSRPGAIYRDPAGSMWIGSREGILRFSHGTFEALDTPEAKAKFGVVMSFFADREGNLWLGTEANGLARLRPVSVRTLTAADGLFESSTRCVFRDSRDDVWVGTYLGFSRISRGGKTTSFSQMDGNPIPTVTSIAEDARGRMWIAAGGRLLLMENDNLSPVPGWTNVFDIKVIFRDTRGDMWVGTDGEGLFRFSDGNMTGYRSRDGLANNQIRALLSDRDGALWIGTTTGLSHFQDGKFTTLGVTNGLANNRIMSLCQDAGGALWIGTRGGLSRLQNGRIVNLRQAEGLPNDYVFNVLDDGRGNYWLSSGHGIAWARKTDLDAVADGKKQKLEVTSLGYRDGLRTASLVAGTQPNACTRGDGTLMFCSLKGLVIIASQNHTANPLAPPVRIEHVFINKQEKPADQFLDLSPGPCELEIHYTALSYVAPEKVLFKYRLSGIDGDWVTAGTRRFAHYASLPPGKYFFQVIACNNEGVWNESGSSYSFNLPPRFYQSLWFLLGVLLFVAALASAFYWLRIYRLGLRERELQRRVDEAIAQVKVLRGLLPICGGCKKIRDDKGYWSQIENYIALHSNIQFSHSLCPDCLKKFYPEVADEVIADMKAEAIKKAKNEPEK
jgi:ligand-binding sensor domain-containing protein